MHDTPSSSVPVAEIEIATGYDGFAAFSSRGGRIGLLLLPEMFGVTPAMQDAARDFALAGVSTLVANIFWRAASHRALTYEGVDRERAQARADSLVAGELCDDVRLAIEALAARVPTLECTAVLGHCIGGTAAVTVLDQTSVAAAISYYGFGISKMGKSLARTSKPVQLHYGLADPLIPAGEIDAVKAIVGSNSSITLFEYPKAGHSFCNRYRPMYDAAQAQIAHERTLALLGQLQRDKAAG